MKKVKRESGSLEGDAGVGVMRWKIWMGEGWMRVVVFVSGVPGKVMGRVVKRPPRELRMCVW